MVLTMELLINGELGRFINSNRDWVLACLVKTTNYINAFLFRRVLVICLALVCITRVCELTLHLFSQRNQEVKIVVYEIYVALAST